MYKSLKINRLCAFFFFFLLFFALIIGLNGCLKEEIKTEAPTRSLFLRYAKNFKIDTLQQGALHVSVQVFIGKDTSTYEYLLLKNGASTPQGYTSLPIIHIPIKRAVILSGSHHAYLKLLDAEKTIVGFSNKKYAADSSLFNQITLGNILEIGDGPSLQQEAIYNLKPDVIIAFATGSAFDSNLEKLKKAKIPVLYVSEWQETSPLGKAEWIYLFDALVQTNKAHDLFETERISYETYKDSLHALHLPCPKVLLGGPSSGYWFAPGDNSYTATLIKDAGGCIVFSPDSSRERRFSLEQAFHFAKKAQVWLHPGIYENPQMLLAEESRVKFLNPFINKRIFNFDKQKGKAGALDFYENGVTNPSKVLLEVINILHLDTAKKNLFNWYRNIFYN